MLSTAVRTALSAARALMLLLTVLILVVVIGGLLIQTVPSESPTPASASTPSPSATPVERPDRSVVMRVLDGKTMVMDSGASVVLAGIEVPACRAERARQHLAALVLRREVESTPAPGHGHYVEVGGLDVGLSLLQHGHATASLAEHPRAQTYRYVSDAPRHVAVC